MPLNIIIIRSLLNFCLYYGDNFKIECPTGSGKMMIHFEVAKDISDRLAAIFLPDEKGRRPVHGGTEKFQTDSGRWLHNTRAAPAIGTVRSPAGENDVGESPVPGAAAALSDSMWSFGAGEGVAVETEASRDSLSSRSASCSRSSGDAKR